MRRRQLLLAQHVHTGACVRAGPWEQLRRPHARPLSLCCALLLSFARMAGLRSVLLCCAAMLLVGPSWAAPCTAKGGYCGTGPTMTYPCCGLLRCGDTTVREPAGRSWAAASATRVALMLCGSDTLSPSAGPQGGLHLSRPRAQRSDKAKDRNAPMTRRKECGVDTASRAERQALQYCNRILVHAVRALVRIRRRRWRQHPAACAPPRWPAPPAAPGARDIGRS